MITAKMSKQLLRRFRCYMLIGTTTLLLVAIGLVSNIRTLPEVSIFGVDTATDNPVPEWSAAVVDSKTWFGKSHGRVTISLSISHFDGHVTMKHKIR